MKVTEQSDVCASFFKQLRRAPVRVLMLDYDGTLAPFTIDRARAYPYREIPELISKIMSCGTRVVLISGRPATELLFLSGIHPHPEIWGSHGIERLYPDGSYEVQEPQPKRKEGLQVGHESLRSAGLAARIEVKPGGIAVHWRGLSSDERTLIEDKIRDIFSTQLTRYDLDLVPFDGGLEILGGEKNKGDALNTILREAGSGVAAAYLGDDRTDEDAFHAIKGHGLAVLVRREARATAADIWLRPPEELNQFLQEWLMSCGAAK
jgi:trehalose 6-phosphate phosphatase